MNVEISPTPRVYSLFHASTQYLGHEVFEKILRIDSNFMSDAE